MNVLLTNDDGVYAPGLFALFAVLKKQNCQVTVLAPDKNWSACGHVKTMTRPMRIETVHLRDGSEAFACDGGPSDCVALAMMGAIETPVDLIISGINPNANIGLDVTYSGTVTAAMEASVWSRPGFAVSLDTPFEKDSPIEFDSAAEVAVKIIKGLINRYDGGLPAPIWNINIPYRKDGDYAGTQFTRQGVRLYRDALEKRLDPRGKPYYWIGGEAPSGVIEDGTDYGALKKGYISVTPLNMDMTDHDLLKQDFSDLC